MSVITKETTNSSVLQNIGISALKGAAINLGVQAVGRNLKKDNLLSTLAVGAMAGIADSFIESKIPNSRGIASRAMSGLLLGGGNAIINKSSIGGTALKYAVIGTATRLLLTIPKALASEGDWKVEWSMQLPKGALKRFEQEEYDWGCTQAVTKSIAKYLGKTITNEGSRIGYDFYRFAAEMNGFQVTTLSKGDLNLEPYNNLDHFYMVVGGYLKRGWPIAATYFNGYYDHTVGVWRITKKRHITKIDQIKYQIDITDPATGDYQKSLSQYDFEHSIIRAVKPY